VVISFVDMTFVHKASQLQSILDGLAEHIAVLDEQGTIRMVNAAWTRFARENGDPGMMHSGPGTNYLAVCQEGAVLEGGDYSSRAAMGLRAVLDGRTEHFSMEYPCHSEQEERWFVLNVNPLRGTAGGVVVSHVNVTSWRKEHVS
jgi:two-component system CheB/CheR fusion protein